MWRNSLFGRGTSSCGREDHSSAGRLSGTDWPWSVRSASTFGRTIRWYASCLHCTKIKREIISWMRSSRSDDHYLIILSCRQMRFPSINNVCTEYRKIATDLEVACGRRTIRTLLHRPLGLDPCGSPQAALRLRCYRHNLAVAPRHRKGGIWREMRWYSGNETCEIQKKYSCKTCASVVSLPHTLEVSSVSLLSPHHDPHGAPLCDVQRFHYPRYLIHKTYRSSYVVQNFDVPYLESDRIWERITNVCHKMAFNVERWSSTNMKFVAKSFRDGRWRKLALCEIIVVGNYLFPRHRHVLKQLVDGVRHILQSSKINLIRQKKNINDWNCM